MFIYKIRLSGLTVGDPVLRTGRPLSIECLAYERAGKAICLGSLDGQPRQGSITIVGSVSPPGGDFINGHVYAQVLYLCELTKTRNDKIRFWTRMVPQ